MQGAVVPLPRVGWTMTAGWGSASGPCRRSEGEPMAHVGASGRWVMCRPHECYPTQQLHLKHGLSDKDGVVICCDKRGNKRAISPVLLVLFHPDGAA